jgi:RNA polymerase sigma-70 factor (sigma-E family)
LPVVTPREDFDDYVRARYDRLRRLAYVLCGDWQHAEDLVQTTLAKAYVAHRRGHVASLDAYVHRALVTTQASWWRRRWHGEVATAALPDSVAYDAYDTADSRAAVVAALGTLPPGQRAVLALRYLADLSEADTAAALGCSIGTVKSRASRALTALRATDVLEGIHHG